MTNFAETAAGNTSSYYPFYQMMFETADTASIFWQPLLKAIGRSQLELAGLQARQAQAVIHWTHQMLQPASPLDLFNANVRLWQMMTAQYADVVPRVVAAVSTATEAVAPIMLPAPAKRSRDTLILLDRGEDAGKGLERKVA
jgi:hypothetical protein